MSTAADGPSEEWKARSARRWEVLQQAEQRGRECDDLDAWDRELEAARTETDRAALAYWEGELDLARRDREPDDEERQ